MIIIYILLPNLIHNLCMYYFTILWIIISHESKLLVIFFPHEGDIWANNQENVSSSLFCIFLMTGLMVGLRNIVLKLSVSRLIGLYEIIKGAILLRFCLFFLLPDKIYCRWRIMAWVLKIVQMSWDVSPATLRALA